jgi:hypothetical protein
MTTEMSDVVGKAVDILYAFTEENPEFTNDDLLKELEANGYTFDENDLDAVLDGLTEKFKKQAEAARAVIKLLEETGADNLAELIAMKSKDDTN